MIPWLSLTTKLSNKPFLDNKLATLCLKVLGPKSLITTNKVPTPCPHESHVVLIHYTKWLPVHLTAAGDLPHTIPN